MKIAELEENIAKYDIKSQFAEAMPNISIDAEYRSSDDLSSKGSTSETTEITANLKVPIFKGGKNLSKIKQAKIIANQRHFMPNPLAILYIGPPAGLPCLSISLKSTAHMLIQTPSLLKSLCNPLHQKGRVLFRLEKK